MSVEEVLANSDGVDDLLGLQTADDDEDHGFEEGFQQLQQDRGQHGVARSFRLPAGNVNKSAEWMLSSYNNDCQQINRMKAVILQWLPTSGQNDCQNVTIKFAQHSS